MTILDRIGRAESEDITKEKFQGSCWRAQGLQERVGDGANVPRPNATGIKRATCSRTASRSRTRDASAPAAVTGGSCPGAPEPTPRSNCYPPEPTPRSNYYPPGYRHSDDGGAETNDHQAASLRGRRATRNLHGKGTAGGKLQRLVSGTNHCLSRARLRGEGAQSVGSPATLSWPVIKGAFQRCLIHQVQYSLMTPMNSSPAPGQRKRAGHICG